MNTTELAAELGCEVTPEPSPVRIYHERCPRHNFFFVSMPRDEESGDMNYVAKCPLSACLCGILKPRADD